MTWPTPSGIGARIPRLEDERLLRGGSRYVSDLIATSRALRVKVLRSPYPHARIVAIDASRARVLPGVVDVLTPDQVMDGLIAAGGPNDRELAGVDGRGNPGDAPHHVCRAPAAPAAAAGDSGDHAIVGDEPVLGGSVARKIGYWSSTAIVAVALLGALRRLTPGSAS